MKIQSLGHVVLKVRNRQRAEEFYNGLLGLPIVAREEPLQMTFFSLGDHHDFAIAATGDDAPAADERSPGLAHVAFCIGDNLDQLREAKKHLEANGLELRAVDHEVSRSLYFHDPDGNQVEVYVDGLDTWKQDPTRVAQGAPLAL
jgi:catechol 2,3-dioxygenase